MIAAAAGLALVVTIQSGTVRARKVGLPAGSVCAVGDRPAIPATRQAVLVLVAIRISKAS